MQGNVRLQFARHPLRQRVELLVGIVLARNEQRRDFRPDIRLVNEIFERFQHRLERTRAALGVEALGERLEVHVRRVHAREQALARLFANEARGDGDVLHATRAAGGRRVERVFHEDDRIVVGVGDARASEPLGRARDRVRHGERAQARHLAALRDVPVLAERAGEVAARRAEREDRRAGQEVVERLLLDRIDAESGRPAVSRQLHALAVLARAAHEAQAPLPRAHLAEARA